MSPSFQRILRSHRFCWLFACGMGAAFFGLTFHAKAQPEIDGNPDSSAFIRIPKDTDDWIRHFRIGAVVGFNISANFNVNSGAILGNNPGAGIYDNGYVRTDSTGNQGGSTWYWGYNDASQYNASAHTLTMTGSSSFSITGGGNTTSDGGALPGFEMAYGWNFWYWKHARVGWELGFDWLPISITDNHSMSATVNQTTYTFSTIGIDPPTAPYQGSFNGPSTFLGTNYTSSAATPQPGQITGSRKLDVSLYAVRLGPSFYWDLTEHVGMSLGAGPAIGIVSGDCSYNELITAGGTSTRNSGSFGSTEVVYGGYVSSTVMYHIEDNGQIADIYLGVQYMPMQDAQFNGSGRSSTLNLNGQVYISAGINWPF